MVRRKDRSTRRPAVSRRPAPTPVRKPGEARAAVPENGNGGPGTGPAEWFSVAEAAELLEVNSSRIFDGIRDGKLRVRFKAATPGAGERPLVSSEELCRKARDREAGVPEMAAVAAEAAEAEAPVEVETPSAPAEPPNEVTAGDDASEEASEASVAPATAAKKKAGKATTRKAASTRGGKARREPDDGRESRSEAERALERESKRRQELEDRLEEWSEEREEQQRTRVSLVGQVQEHKRRAAELERELAATRRQIDLAEDRIEASLKAVYERDVSVARLESQLEASSQVRDAGDEYVNQLQSRLTRVEDRAEEKEREIRRLALGLGEARGEIRLLRPPVDSEPARTGRNWIPWAAAGLIGISTSWLVIALLSAERALEGGAVGVAGVVAAFALGRRRSSSP